ncbi:DUF4832 domain-containing protein [Tumebacillus permanentifrigoris]|uniref:Uncharacterized protein DUF4832 n=1 Tax=Tumebacillus permanentifrigoris TaxID=378543 RepID=A0A316DFN4_9BACL|nr:DUF4832 domain-containing protein [Tumebacillus permanentifrigoris]PWK16466.1 uncharacterized protein DUF4832 [Tumebacillus permanentifrigoris]
MRTWKVWQVLSVAVLVGISTDVFASTPLRGLARPDFVQVQPQGSEAVLNNPFMGLVPAASGGPYVQPHRLVYMVLSWRDLEPEKGRFAFEEIERKYKFAEWNQRGVKVILRFVLDYGTETKHMDIPDWLYQEIQGDGIWYDEDVGKGFSPNYDNPKLINAHRTVMQKLGERYDHDPRLAYLALGSLGHWGEWHTYSDEKINIPFPKLAVSDQYVQHYLDAFPDKKLLMRRPHPIVQDKQLGLYNDMFGSPRSTSDFNDWFENGYTSSLAGADIPAMPDFWRAGPSGGEFGNAGSVRGLLQPQNIGEILAEAQRSHVSWMGATVLSEVKLDQTEQSNLNSFLKKIGYRFVIRSASFPDKVRQGGHVPVTLVVDNQGVAPFYYPWPLELSLVDEAGAVVASTVTSEDIRRWQPGQIQTIQYLSVPPGLAQGSYTLHVAILDPDTKQPGVEFAIQGKRQDGRYPLGELTVTGKPPLRLP